MFAVKDRLLNAPKFYRRRMYAGLPIGGYVRSRFGHRRLRSLLSPTGVRSYHPYRTIFYPPSYFSGRLTRFVRSHQAVTRENATNDFLATCRRYDLLPVYVPLRRPYRPCQVIRMAKRAGELFIKEKVRSAYRRWLDKRVAPYITSRLGTPPGQQKLKPLGKSLSSSSMHLPPYSPPDQQATGQLTQSVQLPLGLYRTSLLSAGMSRVGSPPCLPAVLSGVANVDLWTDRNSTPIFPLPIIRHPAKYGRKKIGRKRVCALIRTPTPPHLPELYPGK